jgi:hypothetical protein
MKQIIIIGLIIIGLIAISQLNDFELFLINQTSVNACTINADCD